MNEILEFLYSQPLASPSLPSLPPRKHSKGFEDITVSSIAYPEDFDYFEPRGESDASRDHDSQRNTENLAKLSCILKQHGIQVQETKGQTCPPEAEMHDCAAAIPALVVSPRTEQEVAWTLRSFKYLGLYGVVPISVKSGGHGYFNGATCSGVMLNMSNMDDRRINGDTLFVEPGCNLGKVINVLADNHKAVPHGDCFGVGAGGHFLTAGWDLILSRRYGLGSQSVIGGRIVLWNGCILDIDENNHPKLLHAMRGGAAAEAGVVTQVRLRLIDEPPRATWRFRRLSRQQLKTCVANNAFSNAENLPRDITVIFHFHFESDRTEPVCSFNIVSLLTAKETIPHLIKHLGREVASFVGDVSQWTEKSIVDLRMLPASNSVAKHPKILEKATPQSLHENPEDYWNEISSRREMARSYFNSRSYWIKPDCGNLFLNMYDAFEAVQEQSIRERMYALVILGGGRTSELQDQCSMPLGRALARFELHWDDPEKEEQRCRFHTERVSRIIEKEVDPVPHRPYRGDIWLPEQAKDIALDKIFKMYDRRFT